MGKYEVKEKTERQRKDEKELHMAFTLNWRDLTGKSEVYIQSNTLCYQKGKENLVTKINGQILGLYSHCQLQHETFSNVKIEVNALSNFVLMYDRYFCIF